MTNNHVRFFKDINKMDTQLVGGKGANLGEMTQTGIPVPNGFCVTTDVFKAFMESNQLNGLIEALLKDVSQEKVTRVSVEVRQLILAAEIPVCLNEALVEALAVFDETTYFSIRSSATAEDLDFASFAGQQDTYLNIRGFNEVLTHIRRCWASLYTERAILYRLQNRIQHKDVTMAVVVQQMVMAERSGILFTADPVTGHRQVVSIDAGFGLGEALVSGLVSPDIYKVDKRTKEVIECVIANKQLAIRPLMSGGTERVKLGREEGGHRVLNDPSIIALAALAETIENHYGKPQDIEWAMVGKDIYILQSRAITSLYPLPCPSPNDQEKHIYISANHLQSMLQTLSPMGLDFMAMIFRVSDVPLSTYQSSGMINAGGRFYIDISGVLHTRLGREKIVGAMMGVEVLMAKALEKVVKEGVFKTRSPLKSKIILHTLWTFKAVPFKILSLMFFKDTSSLVTTVDKNIEIIGTKIHDAIRTSEPGSKRLEVIYERLPLLKAMATSVIPYLVAGILSLKLLERMATKAFGNTDLVVEMSKGLQGNVTTEMGLLVGDLADEVRQSPLLIKVFEDEDYLSLFDRVEHISGHERFKHLFKNFFDRYGCRANGEIDIASVRWRENPEQIARSVMSMVKGMEDGQHRSEFAETVQGAEAACGTFIEAYVARKGRLKGLLAKRLVKVMRHGMPIREHHKFMMMGIYDAAKVSMLEDARDLVEKGYIKSVEEIFWLQFKELYEVYQSGLKQENLIRKRQEAYKHYDQLRPPRVMTSDGEILHGTYDATQYPQDALIGIAVSSGVIEGIARVITNPLKESLAKGEILVAPFTDPSWTPLFLNAAGLVMEVGGQLTHGTVVAREYGLPAVVGVEKATTQIHSGDRIRVDGHAGYVVILERSLTSNK